MSSIVGTIISVEKYLSKEKVSISINSNTPEERKICLPEKRKYTIPAYQREIRWKSDNVNVLLSDLINGPKYLGNVILSLGQNNKCEIIDGQQRTTILQMIVACIANEYKGELDSFDYCEIENESLPGLSDLIAVGFDEDRIDSKKLDFIRKSDCYLQMDRYKALWEILCSSPIIHNNRYSASTLIKNIRESEINLIANHSGSQSDSIRCFLDVNIKGVRLDTEDRFKGYLFQASSKDEIKQLWQENKKLCIIFNQAKQPSDNKRYPLMKIYEHFFYCDLFSPKKNMQDFRDLTFGEDFCLTKQFKASGKDFYQGTHIIEVIQNAVYLLDSLNRINRCLSIMIDIIENSGPSDSFKKLFVCDDKKDKIDSISIENTHSILKRILLDKETIPKVLVLKYMLSFLDDQAHPKTDYSSIYSVYAASTLFTVFASKKESSTFYSFVKEPNWITLINKWCSDFVSSYELTKGKLLATYSFTEGTENSIDEQVRSKSLAAVFNFLRIEAKGQNAHSINVSNARNLNDFLKDPRRYSIEHFIIGESGNLSINTEKHKIEYTYPPKIKKMRNSLFNYIFIPEKLNGDLGNCLLFEKLDQIMPRLSEITCQYSLGYIDLVNKKTYFKNYPTISTINSCKEKEDALKLLDDYFQNTFSDDFLEFSSAFIKSLKF